MDLNDMRRPEEAVSAFGRITTAMGVGQSIGPFFAGVLVDATGFREAGLWISIVAAGAALFWLLAPGLASSPPP
jgi:MFS family permease